jgi:hypothetical protein
MVTGAKGHAMNEEQKQKHQEMQAYWQGYPEAPFSDTFKWVDAAGFEHMTTVRQWSGEGLYNSTAKMIALITETGGKPANQRPPMAPAPVMPAIVNQALEEGEKEVAQNLQAALDGVEPAPAGKQWLTMDIARMVIKPEPGDLYTLELYASGHKWPDLRASKRKLNVVQGLIKHITDPAIATKPQDLSVNAIAYYLEGKPKDSGGYWLDLYHIRNKP